MADTPELDAAWAEAPTRLLAAMLDECPDTSVNIGVTDAAAARLRELDKRVTELAACITSAATRHAVAVPAPVAAPAGDWPPVVTSDMLNTFGRARFGDSDDYTEEEWPEWGNGLRAVFASLPRPAPAATAPAVAPEPPAAVVPWVPKGWKLVPVEPTREQTTAMYQCRDVPGNSLDYRAARYRAAMNAAPPPPPLTEEERARVRQVIWAGLVGDRSLAPSHADPRSTFGGVLSAFQKLTGVDLGVTP